MEKAIRRRNRVTHPKNPADIAISDSDMKTFNQAVRWFAKVMVELKSKVTDNLCFAQNEEGV